MTPPFSSSISSRFGTTFNSNIQQNENNNDSGTQTLQFDSGSATQPPVETKQERLERELGSLFRKYNCNLNDIIDILLKITGDKIDNLEKYDETKINNVLSAAEKAFDEIYNKDSQSSDTDRAINKARQYYNYIESGGSLEDFDNKDKVQTLPGKSADDIRKYFEDKFEEYKNLNESTAKDELKMDFYRILAQTPDAEKNRLLPVLLTVLKDANDVENFFNSFDDKNLRTQCADKVDIKTLKELNQNGNENKNISFNILKNMSVERVDEYLKSVDKDYQELYNSYSDIFQTVLEKIKNNEPLGPDNREVELKEKLDEIFSAYNIVLTSLPVNENFSKEDVENRTNRVLETQRQYGTEQLYLESLAQFINDNKISLNIAEEKLEQLKNYLDEATDGKYSEVANAIAEKNSAYDSEKGGFKTAAPDEVAQQQQTVQNLTKKYVVTEQEQQTGFTVEGIEPDTAEAGSFAGFVFRTQSKTEQLFAVVKNKVDNLTADMIKEAVDTYKSSGRAAQFKVLILATGRVFSAVLKGSDAATLGAFIDGGNKCRTLALTQQVQDKISEEEKKNDVA